MKTNTPVWCLPLLGSLLGCATADKGSPSPTPAAPVATEQGTSGVKIPDFTPVLSGIAPTSVPAGGGPTPELRRPYFDAFSWQTFIALAWPADPNQRGVPLNPNDPQAFLGMSNAATSVWVSYKNQWDLFGQNPNRPSAWNDRTDPVPPSPGGPTLSHVFGLAKGAAPTDPQDIANGHPTEVNEAFSYPLVDQKLNYARYEIRYNQAQYDFVRGDDKEPASWLYLKNNLVQKQIKGGGGIQMPATKPGGPQGAIMVKAAWKVLSSADDASRYYVVDEVVLDPETKKPRKQKLGLVGLHIVQKLDKFSQWIWSSFEHVDNVPPDMGAPKKGAYSFNNGTSLPTTDRGYANKPTGPDVQPVSARMPVQVVRLNKIPTTPAGLGTDKVNEIYRALVGKTWVANYQLVITQWPTKDTSFQQFSGSSVYPTDAGLPFPVDGCANTTMETYFQDPNDALQFGNSCMSCHYQASATDFSWSLVDRSYIQTKTKP